MNLISSKEVSRESIQKRAKIAGQHFAQGNKYKIEECPILDAA